MPARVIPIINMKGGVGKTTLTVALAEVLSIGRGYKVLVLDLDAQASCTFAMVGRPGMEVIRREGLMSSRIYRRLLNSIGEVPPVPDLPVRHNFGNEPMSSPRDQRVNLDDFIYKGATSVRTDRDYRLDLIGASPELQTIERKILYALGYHSRHAENPGAEIFKFTENFLQQARYRYDLILVDCPPGISTFTSAALRLAHKAISPVMPEYLSEMGLRVFAETVLRQIRREHGTTVKTAVVFNRYDASSSDHTAQIQSIEQLVREKDDVLVGSPIRIPQSPEMSRVSEARGAGLTVPEKYGQALSGIEEFARFVVS